MVYRVRQECCCITLNIYPYNGNARYFYHFSVNLFRHKIIFPDRAEALFAQSEENAKARYEHLQKLVALYA